MAGGFRELLEELFAPLGGVTIKRMFGGLGVFKETLMFALVSDDVLYLKADEATAPRFEGEGYGRWTYPGHKRAVAMPYWQLPERLLDEPDEFVEWARAAFEVARRNRTKQKKPKAARKPAAAKPATAGPKPSVRAAPGPKAKKKRTRR